MASYSYTIKYGSDWSATVTVNYTTSYNASTNQTTVALGDVSWAYFGKADWGTSASSTITITAADNTSSTGSTSATTPDNSSTHGGVKTFTGTPSPNSITVTHSNATGAKSVNIGISSKIFVNPSANGTQQVTIKGDGSTTAASGTYAPASSVTCSTADIGSAPTIQISRNSSSFTHTLTYEFGSLSGTIVTKTTSTTITSWKFPTSFYAEIPNAKSGTGTITCNTYNGDTLLGTKTCSFTATTNESLCKPTLSPTVEDSNSEAVALTGNANTFIRYISDAAITSGAAARNNATLKSIKVTCGSQSITTSTGTIQKVDSGTFTFTATDSRGYSTTQTIEKTLINYINPTCNLNISNPTTDGNLSFTITGNYFNSSFGAVNNTLSVSYKYKAGSGNYSNNIEVTNITLNNNTYTANISLTGLDYKETYTFQAFTIDKIKSVNSAEKVIKTTPVFSWSNDDFEFNVPVKFSGKTLFDIVYPVGAIYMSVSEISPATLFGGTWEQIENRFLLAAGSSYTAGNTGGAKTVTLTESQIPSHTHSVNLNTGNGGVHTHVVWRYASGSGSWGANPSGRNCATTLDSGMVMGIADSAGEHNHAISGNTGSTGGGKSHNNMPPYLVVYMWKRTA